MSSGKWRPSCLGLNVLIQGAKILCGNSYMQSDQWIPVTKSQSIGEYKYCKISNIRCTISHNLNDSCLILLLSLPSPLKPGDKSRMKT